MRDSSRRTGYTKLGDALSGLELLELAKVEPPEGWEEHDRAIRQAEAEALAREKEDRDRLFRRQLVEWGVPVKDVDGVFDGDLQDTAPLLAVKEHHQGIMILSGSYGCGKTTAAAWWLAQPGEPHAYLRTQDPVFIPTYKLERFSRYDGEQMEKLERARRLVIDDLGREFSDSKGNFVTFVGALVDSRYADQLPMLITTNMKLDEFRELYGERTVERLREVGRWREIDAPSLRRRKDRNT